jgi:hypothetical protein
MAGWNWIVIPSNIVPLIGETESISTHAREPFFRIKSFDQILRLVKFADNE